jgi:hypothetical protein
MAGTRTASITRAADKLVVIVPHAQAFASRAHALHGKWNGHAWIFAAAQLEAVEALCVELFDAVEVTEAPPFDLNAVTALDGEITVPGLDEDEPTEVSALSGRDAREDSGSNSDSESRPVHRVWRELEQRDAPAAEDADATRMAARPAAGPRPGKRLTRAAVEAEIAELRQRIRELESLLEDLD